jgi:hypothetical protein
VELSGGPGLTTFFTPAGRTQQVLNVGLILGQLALVAAGVFVALRLVRKLKAPLENYALHHLPYGRHLNSQSDPAGTAPNTDQERDGRHEQTVRHWFQLLERFAVCSVVLAGIWLAGHIVHLGRATDSIIGLAIAMLAIVMVARLLILASRTISHALAELGNRHLGQGKYTRYWERVTRLFPFGEKCFEAAVYVSAASLCVAELEFITFVAHLGPRLVACIGIFFGTRVLIELSTVLLYEAFGMYAEDRPADQMSKTLLPLLQSICQYGLYFGSGIMMLSVMGIPT